MKMTQAQQDAISLALQQILDEEAAKQGWFIESQSRQFLPEIASAIMTKLPPMGFEIRPKEKT